MYACYVFVFLLLILSIYDYLDSKIKIGNSCFFRLLKFCQYFFLSFFLSKSLLFTTTNLIVRIFNPLLYLSMYVCCIYVCVCVYLCMWSVRMIFSIQEPGHQEYWPTDTQSAVICLKYMMLEDKEMKDGNGFTVLKVFYLTLSLQNYYFIIWFSAFCLIYFLFECFAFLGKSWTNFVV